MSDNTRSLRPAGVPPHAWVTMQPNQRAAAAMFAKTEEWDFRGSLSDMKPIGIQPEELDIVARVLLALPSGELERLAVIGRQAAAEMPRQPTRDTRS